MEVARSAAPLGGLASHVRQCHRIADGDLVPREVDQALVLEQMQVAGDDLAYGADRVGQLLL
jgi:hypothetical protein